MNHFSIPAENTLKWGSIPSIEGVSRYVLVLYIFKTMKYSPEAPGAIQVRLAYLRLRKAALDELILSLERYSVYELPSAKRAKSELRRPVRVTRLAGAA
jgi:hypothetical protein